MKMRVWWYPQIGTKTFYIPVHSVGEAVKIMDTLSYYDCFLMNVRVRGDYCNCGGLEVFDDETGEWEDWYYEDEEYYFDDPREYLEKIEPGQYEWNDADMKAMAGQVTFEYGI